MEGKSILVLCDSYPFLKVLSKTLASLASTVYEASDISSAKQLISEGEPDLVIIDLPTEKLANIKKLVNFIKEQDRYPFVDRPIVIFIYTLEEERIYAENLGFDAIFPKMFKVKEFMDKIKELLKERKEGEKWRQKLL